MRDIQLEVRQDAMSLHKLFVGLAGESNDNVCRDRTIRNFAANFSNKIAIILLGVPALHVEEHLVIARLNRDLDVRHDFGKFGNSIHEFFGEIVGMRCEEANTLDALDLMNNAKKRGKVGTVWNILAIPINDLAQ